MTKCFRAILLGGVSSLVISGVVVAADAAKPKAEDLKPVVTSAPISAPIAGDPQNRSDDEDDDDVVEEIEVRGFRASLQSAIANKREADTVIESITAEDIGRLPDISIADSLARLPGITSQRTNGQSSAINVRGLSQSLTFATLNGREQVAPNGNRSVEFAQFPSELIGGVDVYKSQKASLIAGGLAGTVDLKTIRPLDIDDTVLNVNARLNYNDRAGEIFDANEFGYRISAVYVDKFFDDTLGISLGYARLDQADVSTRFVGFDYDNFAPNDFNGDGLNDAVSFGFEVEEQGGSDERDGLIGTVQWRPNSHFSWEVDSYYSKFTSDGYGRGIRVIGPQAANSGNPNTLITDPIVVGQAVVGGTFSRNVEAPTDPNNPSQFGLTIQNINDNQFDEDELISIGNKFEYVDEKWSAALDFTYSRADSFFANEVSNILPIVSLDGGVPGVSNNLPNTPVIAANQQVTLGGNVGGIPVVNFANDFTDRTLLRLANFGAFPFENEDELFAFALDFEYQVNSSWLRSLEFGGRYSDRDASQFRESAGPGFGNDAGFFQFASQPFTPIALTPENSSIECFSGQFAANGFPCFIVIEDPRALFESLNGPIELNQNEGFTLDQSFIVREEVLSFYGQANLDFNIGSVGVTGNIGLRVVDTDQASQAQSAISAGEISYTEFLPSLNLVFKADDNQQVRFGFNRALSRPPIFQLGSGFGLGFNGTILSGGGAGNPLLRPFVANQFDLGYEYYFDNGGIFTVAGFYKDLESFIVSEELVVDFDGLDLEDLLSADQFAQFIASGAGTIGLFNGPVNGEGGYVWGIEVAYSQPFDFLDIPVLKDFGVNINYSYTESEIDFSAANSGQPLNLPLPGLSDHVANGQLYYEHESGFSARFEFRYRSRFVSPQVGIDQQLPFTDDELVLGFQASYDFPGGSALEGLSILAQAINLTDEPVTTFFGVPEQRGTTQFFGRQFLLGASYRF